MRPRRAAIVWAIAGAALLHTTVQYASAQPLLEDGGFESNPYVVDYRPAETGVWVGDLNEISLARDGIIPYEGFSMIHFMHTQPEGPSDRLGAEIWQLVDLRPMADLIATGRAVGVATAWYNRVPGNATTDTEFAVGIGAYDGDPSSFPQQWRSSELDYLQTRQSTDGQLNTWERGVVYLPLPTDTDFACVHVKAQEDIRNDLIGQEFHGHYADAITFRVFVRPDRGGMNRRLDPPILRLEAFDLHRGSNATLIVSDGAPNALTHVFYSRIGDGETPAPQLGVTLDLANPTLLDSLRADAAGIARLDFRVPQRGPQTRVWIQAAQHGRLSPVLNATID